MSPSETVVETSSAPGVSTVTVSVFEPALTVSSRVIDTSATVPAMGDVSDA